MNVTYSWHTGLSWALGIGLTVWIFAGLPGVVAIHGTDFDHYYKAGEQIFRGENIYYDAQADWAREGIDSWYLYPPYFAAVFYPLTWLGPVRAKAVFAVLAAATLLGIDLILLSLRKKLSPRAPLLDPFIHLLVLAPYPSSLLLGSLQIEGFLFLLFLLTVMGTLEIRRLWGTGCAYAAGVMIKLWPGPFLLSLAVVWRKRIFLPVLTIGLGAGILFTGLAGWRVQWNFLQTILPALMHYADDYIDNQSLTLFLRESFSWSDGFIQMIRLAILASYALAVYHARDSLKNRNPRAVAVNASLFAAVSLLITPTAWSATHIRLLLPLVTSGALSVDPSRRFSRWGFISLISVLLYIYPQGTFHLNHLYWLDRYPLLWATWTQYGIFLYLAFQNTHRIPVTPPQAREDGLAMQDGEA